MEEFFCDSTRCEIVEKICRIESGKGPKWCPTKTRKYLLSSAMK